MTWFPEHPIMLNGASVIKRIRDEWAPYYSSMQPGRGMYNIYKAWTSGPVFPDNDKGSLLNPFSFDDFYALTPGLPDNGAIREWQNTPQVSRLGGTNIPVGAPVYWWNPTVIQGQVLYNRGFRYVNPFDNLSLITSGYKYQRQMCALQSFDKDWYWTTSDHLEPIYSRNGLAFGQRDVKWVKVSGATLRGLGFKFIGWTPTLDRGSTQLNLSAAQPIGGGPQDPELNVWKTLIRTSPNKVNVRPQ